MRLSRLLAKRKAFMLLSVLLIALAGACLWFSQPFIDPSAKGSNPVPMPAPKPPIPASKEALLVDFVENKAAGTDALGVLKNGQVLFEYGPTDVPSNLHSGRKSILSLLYGIAQEKGLVDVDATLSELGIDETHMPLTDTEKTATIAHLLQARSGVYLPSGAETQTMKNGRPERGQYKPGEHHYYNNWDFNVAGAILEQETGLSIGEAIENWLSIPLGMEDFHQSHVIYDMDRSGTQYRTYRIHMSARDLSRIGCLVQQKGIWNEEQIVPAEWIARTTQACSTVETRSYDGYGYLWWLNSERDVIAADGWGGQFLFIDRNGPFVLVSRQDTGNSKLDYVRFVYPSHYDDPLDLFAIHDILVEHAP